MQHNDRNTMPLRDRGNNQHSDVAVSKQSAACEAGFKLIPFDEIPLATDCNFIIENLIPREGLVVVWGAPKSGKSFWIFDALMHVALGWEYRGWEVQQGPVVYVVCEGERGLGARAAAWRMGNLEDEAQVSDFYGMPTRLDLVGQISELIGFIDSNIGDVKPVAICIDTLNRTIRGSESSDQDMSAYIEAADTIREAFGCAIIIVHHCGLEATRPRGHTSLTGACDAQLAVKRSADKAVTTTTVEYMKDGAEGDAVHSTLEVVTVGQNDRGKDITSCIIHPAAAPAGSGKPTLSDKNYRALAVLNDSLVDNGQPHHGSALVPANTMTVTLDQWRKRLARADVINEQGNPRQQYSRIKTGLQSRGCIGVGDGVVWAVRP